MARGGWGIGIDQIAAAHRRRVAMGGALRSAAAAAGSAAIGSRAGTVRPVVLSMQHDGQTMRLFQPGLDNPDGPSAPYLWVP